MGHGVSQPADDEVLCLGGCSLQDHDAVADLNQEIEELEKELREQEDVCR